MKLVVLYGAPGVGKLTVARALAKRTGYGVMHNHLTVDLVTSVFPFGSDQARRLSSAFRREMLREAALADIPGVIFTFVYAAGIDDDNLRGVVETVESAGGTVALVLLVCDVGILRERIGEASREEYAKIRDAATLDSLMAEMEFDRPYLHSNGLTINTTSLSPDETAKQIHDFLTVGSGSERG